MDLHLMAYPQVLIMTTMPVVFGTFLSTLDWRNVIYSLLMFPICWLICVPSTRSTRSSASKKRLLPKLLNWLPRTSNLARSGQPLQL